MSGLAFKICFLSIVDSAGWNRNDGVRVNQFALQSGDQKNVQEGAKINALPGKWPEGIKEGSFVERGKDWQFGDQDGGEGNYGTVTKTDRVIGVVAVKWHKTDHENEYRLGFVPKKHDPTNNKPMYDVQLVRQN
jgi:hypothetical protein